MVHLKLVYAVLNVAGSDHRQGDIFSTETLLAKGFSALKGLKVSWFGGSCARLLILPSQGVENVYTQHNPHLSQTVESLLKGRLKDSLYPFVENPGPNASLQRSVLVMTMCAFC